MARVSPTLLVGASLWLAANSSVAMGFGSVVHSTLLGQPLNFSATVRMEPDETLEPECASAEVHSGEVRIAPSKVRVKLEPGTDPSQRILRVSTTTPIDEPVVTILVTLGCGAAISRQFVSFADPPVIELARASGPTDSASAPIRNGAAVAALAAPASSGKSSAETPPAPPTPAAPPASVDARSAASPSSRRSDVIVPAARRTAAPEKRVARIAAPARSTVAGSRLQLEAAPPVAATVASSPVLAEPSVALAQTSAPAANVAASAAVAADVERERIKALEVSVQRLRDETEAARKAMLSIQSSLKDAQDAKYNNPLIYVLGLLCALLASLLVMSARRRSRPAERPEWWNESMPPRHVVDRSTHSQAVTAHTLDAPDSVPVGVELEGSPSTRGALEPHGFADTFAGEPEVAVVPAPPSAAPAPTMGWAVSPPDVMVERLIDVAQQADFFVALGQEDSAIDLWAGQLGDAAGQIPLPYLELLEMHRRQGNLGAFEAVRDDFGLRFGLLAANRLTTNRSGELLEDLPDTLGRVQQVWSDPRLAMQALEVLMLHRDSAVAPFDLHVYRDMLFLYAVARDLAEQGETPASVDFLLPLDSTDLRLTPSAPSPRESSPLEPFTLDLDMDALAPVATPAHKSESSGPGAAFELSPSGFIDLEDPSDPKATPRH